MSQAVAENPALSSPPPGQPAPTAGEGAPNQPKSLSEQLRTAVVGVRKDLEFTRQILYGQAQYIVRDPISFQSRSLSVEDYQVLIALGKTRPAGEVFDDLVAKGLLTQEQEEEYYKFILALNQRGLLYLPITNGKMLYERFDARRKQERSNLPLKLFSFQIPLLNPNRFLDRTVLLFSLLFQRWFVVGWAAAGLFACFLLLQRWNDFQSPLASILAIQNVLVILGLVTVLKIWHEMGHAYACKYFGGQVPEVGATFILGTPCAYVDASAAWGFTNRWHRIAVNLGGMYFESLISIIAIFTWALTPPSLIHSIAHYTILVSSIVTVLFNANPLMRFDGYYVLSDWLNIPNLRQVSQQAMENFAKRWLLGLPAERVGRTWWGDILLVAFGIASTFYKITLTLGIVGLICIKMPTLGLLTGLFYLFAISIPAWMKLAKYMIASDEAKRVRFRSWSVIVATLAVVTVVMMIPIQWPVAFPGLISMEKEVMVRAPQPGFMANILTEPGEMISENQPMFELRNPEIENQYQIALSRAEQLRVRMQQLLTQNQEEASATAKKLQQAESDLADVERALQGLVISAPQDGILTSIDATELDGRFIATGQPLGKLSNGAWIVRSLADAEQLLDTQLNVGDTVTIDIVGRPDLQFTGKVTEISPAGSNKIDEVALTHVGGGDIAVDPMSQAAVQSFFAVKVAIDQQEATELTLGLRGRVNLPNRNASLGEFVLRRLWQFYHRYLQG